MKRLAGALAVLAAAVAAAPARAQTATPVVGGGSFNAAPLLEPGRYRDTLLLGEYLYYAIPLETGQRLHVRVRVPGVDADTWQRATDAFSINLHTPQRDAVETPVDEDVAGNGNTDPAGVTDANADELLRWDFYGPRAAPFSAAAEGSGYTGPGTWYVSLHSVRVEDRPKVELPIELELDVDGAPVAEEPDATPTPTPTPAPTAAAEEERGDDGGGGGPAPLALAGIALAGLAVGAAGGIAAGRR